MGDRLLWLAAWAIAGLVIFIALYGALLWASGDPTDAVHLWVVAVVLVVLGSVTRTLALRRTAAKRKGGRIEPRVRNRSDQPAGPVNLRVTKSASGTRAGEHPSISAAVQAARPGDTIIVNPGDYLEFVRVDRTLSIVGAAQGNAKVVVAGDLWASGISVSCHLEGIEFRAASPVKAYRERVGDADAPLMAIGVREGATLSIRNCVLRDAESVYGLVSYGCNVHIEACEFSGLASAVSITDGSPNGGDIVVSLGNCTIRGNNTGVLLRGRGRAIIENCLFEHNSHALVLGNTDTSIKNSPFDANVTHLFALPGSRPVLEQCDLSGSGEATGRIAVCEATPEIRRCTIEVRGGSGLEFISGGGVIEDCVFRGGLVAGTGTAITLDSARFSGQGMHEIATRVMGIDTKQLQYRGAAEPRIVDCRFETLETAIDVERGGRPIIESCDISGCQGAAIRAGALGEPRITGGRIHDTRGTALEFATGSSGQINGLEVRTCSRNFPAVTIDKGASPAFRSCLLDHADRNGVTVLNLGNAEFEHCTMAGRITTTASLLRAAPTRICKRLRQEG
jgi:Right handed beta helix region